MKQSLPHAIQYDHVIAEVLPRLSVAILSLLCERIIVDINDFFVDVLIQAFGIVRASLIYGMLGVRDQLHHLPMRSTYHALFAQKRHGINIYRLIWCKVLSPEDAFCLL